MRPSFTPAASPDQALSIYEDLLSKAKKIWPNTGSGVFYDNVNLHQSNIVGSHISYNGGGGVVAVGASWGRGSMVRPPGRRPPS